MPAARYWPHFLAALLFTPLGVIAPKSEVLLLVVLALSSLIIAIAKGGWRLRGRGNPWNRSWTVLACALAWATVSIAWNLTPLSGLRVVGHIFVILAAAYTLAVALRDIDARNSRMLSVAMVVGFTVAALLVAADQATGLATREWYYETIGRPGAFHPSLLNRPIAILLLASWPTAVAIKRLGWPRFAPVAPLLALLLAIAGVSTSNLAACVLGLLTMALVWRFRGRMVRALAVAVVAALVLMPLLPLTVLPPAFFDQRIDGFNSGVHRLYIWEFAAHRILDHPVAGWGVDASPLIPGGEKRLPEGGSLMNVHPHNAFLQVWLELGVPGVILLAVWLWRLFRNVERTTDSFATACRAGLLVSALVIANLSFGLWQTWWMAVLALAFLLATMMLPDGNRDSGLNRPT